MKIKATLTFTAGWADAIRKGSIPSQKETAEYAKNVIKTHLGGLVGPVTHDREDWITIRLSSVTVRATRSAK